MPREAYTRGFQEDNHCTVDEVPQYIAVSFPPNDTKSINILIYKDKIKIAEFPIVCGMSDIRVK